MSNLQDTIHEAVATHWPVETGLIRLTQWIAGFILVSEISILFAGVISRYVIGFPLTWSDELASILFVWLTMLGTVIAFQRGQHMRMTAFVTSRDERGRFFLNQLAVLMPLIFTAIFLPSSFKYAMEELVVITPALEISGGWKSFAVPTGLSMILIFGLFRTIRERMVFTGLLILIGAALAGGLLILLKPFLLSLGNWNLLIFFVGMIGGGVTLGIPIAFVFALSALAFVSTTTTTPLLVLAGRIEEGMSHLILLAVPLFVFLGLQIESNGMARAMVAFLSTLLRHVRGGLSYVLVGAMYLVSGISGSKTADMAAVAPALFPEMQKRGAKPGDLVALLAATGAQTETIPPSIVLITIGSVTGVSIAALFTGGLLPGVVLGITLCGVVWWRYRDEDLSGVTRATLGEITRTFAVALPALALPFVIRSAVVEGVATATEVSTIGIVYSLIVGLIIYGHRDIRQFGRMLIDTAALSGAILFIISAATAVAWSLTQSGFSHNLAQLMKNLPGGAPLFMAFSIVAFVILGSVLEGIPAIVLFGPLVFPIAKTLGIHEVHYAMVVVLAMGLGLFMPPVGVGYYAACAVGRVDPSEGLRPILGYMMALLVGLVIVAIFPWISIGFL